MSTAGYELPVMMHTSRAPSSFVPIKRCGKANTPRNRTPRRSPSPTFRAGSRVSRSPCSSPRKSRSPPRSGSVKLVNGSYAFDDKKVPSAKKKVTGWKAGKKANSPNGRRPKKPGRTERKDLECAKQIQEKKNFKLTKVEKVEFSVSLRYGRHPTKTPLRHIDAMTSMPSLETLSGPLSNSARARPRSVSPPRSPPFRLDLPSTSGKRVARSRSRSPPQNSDDDGDGGSCDDIDAALVGKDGLHHGQRVTPARLKNPGKYTDRSMRQAHSKRSRGRERTASLPSVMGENQHVEGTCVNEYGNIRACKELVTRMNYRPTYVIRERLPLQMLYAMLLDEQPEVVSTYDPLLVKSYLAGVIRRALGDGDTLEPMGWKNLQKFAIHTVNLLSQLNTMTGGIDPITVVAERYLPHMPLRTAYHTIKNSIKRVNDPSPLSILENLKSLVNTVVPHVRLWAYDVKSSKAVRNVLLRQGQLKTHPWDRLKENLERSIELFRDGGEFDLVVRRDDDVRIAADRSSRTRGRPRGGGGRRGRTRVTGITTSGQPTVSEINTRPENSITPNVDYEGPPPTPGRFLGRSERSKSPANGKKSKNVNNRSPPPPTSPGRSSNAEEGNGRTAGGKKRPAWLSLADSFSL
ncbi:hypothetical protein J6590_087498 [Homalodisca vitripennis]|nr:hypothetical protein J6590_087498 [Homalodisca vitripennis]